jgi:hypothetical protein
LVLSSPDKALCSHALLMWHTCGRRCVRWGCGRACVLLVRAIGTHGLCN